MTKLRVLSLSTLFPSIERPGFGRFVARQFDAVAKTGGVDLTVINPVARPLFGGKRSLDSWRQYPVHRMPFGSIPLVGANLNPAFIADAVIPLVRELHEATPFDMVDAQFFFPDGPAAALIAAEFGLPLSIKARGSDINYWGLRTSPCLQMIAAAKQAKGLLTVSEALRAKMMRLGLELDKTTVHYTGVDHALFQPRSRAEARLAVADLVMNDQHPLLVGVGNLIPLKGYKLAIEAMRQLPDARLVIAGRGPEEWRLRKLAVALDLSDRVVLPGVLPPDRLAVLISAADVLVHPSKSEGLANVWIEALACGTPLVITNVGGAREVVPDPSAGRIVEPSSTEIASAVAEILANPIPQAEVAANAARFSWEANAAQLSAHWHRISGR